MWKPEEGEVMADTLSYDEEAYGALTEEEKSKVKEIRGRLDFNNPNTVLQYGAGVQGKISDFADMILSEVRAKDTDYVGKILNDLMFKIKELQIDGLSSGGFFSKIPFVKPLLDNAKKFMAGYRDVSVQIVKIVEELERAKAQLLRDVTTLDNLYEKNIEYFRELNLYILAGKMKLFELQETLASRGESAEKSGGPIEVQKYRDMVQFAGRVDKKLHDLRLSRTLSLQTAPQIRLVQNNNQALAEKIQSSILNTVPLWKSQMVIAISLLRQRNILEVQKGVSETTQALLQKNAEMIKESSADVAKEAERGIVDIETLKKVNADLIGTIEETLKIQQEGKLRRKQAGEEIEKIERELRESLLRIKEMREAASRDTGG
jgi:uncharacterized protein YaaN involved in tellurite resistance